MKRASGNEKRRINILCIMMFLCVCLWMCQGRSRGGSSIQAEGTFGILKQDRWYKRIVRKGIASVKMELYLIAIGNNLYKFHNKRQRQNPEVA